MRVLPARDAASVLSMEEGVRLVDASFRECGAGRAIVTAEEPVHATV